MTSTEATPAAFAPVPAAIHTVVRDHIVETVRNDHKWGTTPVWHITRITMVDFIRGAYAGRTYRDVMVFESTGGPHTAGAVVIGHHQDPVDTGIDAPWEVIEARMDRIAAARS